MEGFEELLNLVYAMPFDSGLWPDIMTRLSDMTGSTGAVLQSPTLVNPANRFALYESVGFDPTELARGVEHYSHLDPFSAPMMATLRGDFNQIAHGLGAIKSMDVLRSSPFWNEHLHRLGIGDFIALILHEPKNEAFPVLTLARRRDGETYTKEAIHTYQAFARHLRFATRLLFKVQGLEQASVDVQAAFDTLATPCALLGPLGQVAFANQALAALASRRHLLQLVGGRLSARAKPSDDRLQAAINQAVQNRRGAELALTDANDDKVVVLVSPINDHNDHIFNTRAARAAVFVLTESPPAPNQNKLARLKAILNLSEHEALIAKDLLNGLAPEDIAMVQGKSLLTVRTQIRDLLRKNNLRRVIDLQAMRRLFSGVENL